MSKEKLRILIVEDEMIIALDLKKILNNLDYSVCSIVTNGYDAIKGADLLKPDIILMDIMISGDLNGIDTAKLIKSKLEIPIIFLTALNDDENYMSAYEVSKYGYIIKPYNEADLKGIIDNAMEQHNLYLKRAI